MYAGTVPEQLTNPVLIPLSKINATFFKLAVTFTGISIVLAAALFVITLLSKTAYEKFDYAKIEKEGRLLKGRILEIKTNYSTTVNSQHPAVITYDYVSNGKEITAEFKTLSSAQAALLKPGDVIAIKERGSESKIAYLEPFVFPFSVFYIIPCAFFGVGAGFFIRLFILQRNRRRVFYPVV